MSGFEGTTFADFEILERLGQGGMGAVYKARQVTLNRIVALKVMAGNLAQDEDFVRRFHREARSAAAINHPNAVKVYVFGEESGTHYIAMEYVEGETLRKRIERLGRIDAEEALLIAEQAAEALAYAWDRAQIIHRDIKPDNIFLTQEGEVKVGDLGLAKSLGAADTGLTATGAMMGSPHYMSPEQARGDSDVDFRSDIYSLGCTLYHMLTGRTPYDADNVMALIHKQVYEAVPAIFKAWPECPSRLGTFVARMVSKKREQRPGNYGALINELQGLRVWLEGRRTSATAQGGGPSVAQPQPVHPTPVPTPLPAKPKPAGSNWALIGGIGVAALVLLGGLAWWIGGRGRSGGKSGPAPSPSVADRIAWARADAPFVNSLGMKFVPVPGTNVLFSVWETRVRDWEAFLKESGYAWKEDAGFEQTPGHPVVKVSWDDAKAFCAWLSKKEGLDYRLPTDDEWSAAVGPGKYPWGDEWPPPADAGNFPGTESTLGDSRDPKPEWMTPGWQDAFPRRAPAGSCRVNRLGLHDLAGNVREWCEDWYDAGILEKRRAQGGIRDPSNPKELAEAQQGNVHRVVRGGSWYGGDEYGLRCAYRGGHPPDNRLGNLGFRCVVVCSVSAPVPSTGTTPSPSPQISAATKDAPFVNSLGMKFVPVPGTNVLFSVWETRVRDWETFLKESGYAWNERAWFEQTPDHPVVRVSWDDAKAFCAWLSKKDGLEYRLPTDDEWSVAAGPGKYPWGDEWPPPADAGNFPGTESTLGNSQDPKPEWMDPKWQDAFPRTAPVGNCRENRLGLHDLAGNVREWCEDWYDMAILEKRRAAGIGDPTVAAELAEIQKGNVRRVVRGGAWDYGLEHSLRCAYSYGRLPDLRGGSNGFRCVLVCSASAPVPSTGTTPSPSPQISAATKDAPFVNSLGMKFVPGPGTNLLFSVWETRVRDWEAFVKESGYAWNEKAGFEQTPDHPVVRVSWDDAKAFCAWLSKKDGLECRLPTDDEWSGAVGPGKFPWGEEWPPPSDAGNFPGTESTLGNSQDPKPEWMTPKWQDAFPRTAPVGSCRVNGLGLYDLAGNVREWCEDWYDAAILEKRRAQGGIGDPSDPKELAEAQQGNVRRVVRGGSWRYGGENLLRCESRYGHLPANRNDINGFRCVVVLGSSL